MSAAEDCSVGGANAARPAVEAAWLRYAKALLRDDQHHRRCDAVLGTDAVARADAPDLRWPGYLGRNYRPGGLLLVATVHREFASGRPPLPTELRDRLVRSTRAWRDEEIDDDAWLRELRTVYRAGLGSHWIVGTLLQSLTRRIGLDVDAVSYVNAARCQVVENPPPPAAPRIKAGVLRLCATSYPLADLVELLQPGAVVMSKGTFDAAAGLMPPSLPVVVVDQRQLCLRAPLVTADVTLPVLTKVGVWAEPLRRLLASASGLAS